MKITKEQGELLRLDGYKQAIVMFHIDLEGENITPDQLPYLVDLFYKQISKGDYGFPFALSGRMPVWAFATLGHESHPAKAVGCYDPRLQAVVITQSHDTSDHLKVGEMLYFS